MADWIPEELLVRARKFDQRGLEAVGVPRWGIYEASWKRLLECPYCSARYLPHPGFADHRDMCDLNPMHLPHIKGEAVAMYGDA